jgi:hypothetical protein
MTAVSFHYSDYADVFRRIRDAGYRAITMREYFQQAFAPGERLLVSRVDVDVKIDRVPRLLGIYESLGLRASFFVRLHAPVYNLLSFGSIAIVRDVIAAGHEIGLHTELVDAERFGAIEAAVLLRNEIDLLATISGRAIFGTASHGDMTGCNNLDFWRGRHPSDFGLLYEAYDESLWKHCRYVSDSEWVRWKAYDNGELMEGDRRSPAEHLPDHPQILHVLTHPESWYERYIYE